MRMNPSPSIPNPMHVHWQKVTLAGNYVGAVWVLQAWSSGLHFFACPLPSSQLKQLGDALLFKWWWKWRVLHRTSHQHNEGANRGWYRVYIDVTAVICARAKKSMLLSRLLTSTWASISGKALPAHSGRFAFQATKLKHVFFLITLLIPLKEKKNYWWSTTSGKCRQVISLWLSHVAKFCAVHMLNGFCQKNTFARMDVFADRGPYVHLSRGKW